VASLESAQLWQQNSIAAVAHVGLSQQPVDLEFQFFERWKVFGDVCVVLGASIISVFPPRHKNQIERNVFDGSRARSILTHGRESFFAKPKVAQLDGIGHICQANPGCGHRATSLPEAGAGL